MMNQNPVQNSAKQSPSLIVDASASGVKCNGGSGVLGHPEVYYSFSGRSEVICHYCGQHFVKQGK